MKKIKVKKDCYLAYRGDGWEKISNFIVKIKYKLISKECIKREIVFIHDNQETEPFMLDSECMATVSGFKAFCLKKGDYLFEGKSTDLNEIWKQEFKSNQYEPVVHLVDGVGYIKEHKIWLFKNLAIKDGKTINPDDNGIFWLNKHKGFKVNNLSYGRPLPKIEKTSKEFSIKKELSLVEEALNENIGGFNGSIIIGYVVANVFSQYIFKNFKFFPILFVYGKYQSGKNIFCELIVKFFGLDMSYSTSAQESSQTGISRLLGYYSFIPVWIDEYRNSDKVKRMSGYFRNIYNKVSPTKAKKEESGTREVPIKGNLIISGEEMPIDTALRSRCFPVNLSANDRNDNAFRKVRKLSKRFSTITFFIIKKMFKRDIVIKLLKTIEMLKQEYGGKKIDPRQAEVFATIVAGRKLLDEYVPVGENFDEWVIRHLKSEKKRREEESPIKVFWDIVEGLLSKGTILKGSHIRYDKDSGKVYVWFAEVFKEYEKETMYKKDGTVRSRQAILDQLGEESYCIYKNKSIRIGNNVRSCIVLDYNKCPGNVQRMARRPM